MNATVDTDMDEGPTDMEIINLMAEVFDMTAQEAIERLICVDYVTARRGLQ